MSLVRRHFWHEQAPIWSMVFVPRKYCLNWFMPALARSSDGSSGTSDEEGKSLHPLSSKNERNESRIWAVVMVG